MKKKLIGRRNSKKLVMPPVEVQKGQTVNSQSPKHSFQLPYLVVSPWWIMHQLGTSMGALGVMLPQRWSKPFCSPKIWWSYEVLGGVKSSFIPKGFWAWYVLILPCCFSLSFSFFFIWCNTYSFLFVSRLFKIHSGSRRWPTPSISNWMIRGKGGLLLCKPWPLLKTATPIWKRN